MSAVDRVFNQMKGKHQESPDIPPDCVARFLCTKASWRGKYRRIICITPTSVVTQYPDTLAITNTWQFINDSDIDGVSLGASDPEEPEFVLSARTDKRVSSSYHGCVSKVASARDPLADADKCVPLKLVFHAITPPAFHLLDLCSYSLKPGTCRESSKPRSLVASSAALFCQCCTKHSPLRHSLAPAASLSSCLGVPLHWGCTVGHQT